MTNGRNLRDGAWSVLVLAASIAGCTDRDASVGQGKQALVEQLPANIVPDTDPGGVPILDPNGIPLDPMWGIQYNELHGLGGFGPYSGGPLTPPNVMFLCAFNIDSDGAHTGVSCMDQWLETNMFHGVFICHDDTAYGLDGHLNWWMSPSSEDAWLKPHAVTVEGPITYDEKEAEDPFHDDDHNIKFYPKDQRLLQTYPASFRDYINIEFDDDETVDGIPTPYWSRFRYDVDHRDEIAFFHSYGILTALYGLDGVHAHPNMGSELHPAFALSAYIGSDGRWKDAPTGNPSAVPECLGAGTGRFANVPCGVDRWASFVRDSGDEGGCGPAMEHMTFADNRNEFKVAYPWFGPKNVNANVSAIVNSYQGIPGSFVPGGFNGFQPNQDQSIVGSFSFLNNSGFVVGADLIFVYGSARLFGMERLFSFDGGFIEGTVDGHPKQWFFGADFTGDGLVDMAHAFDDGDYLSVDVYPNNGNGTLGPLQRWATRLGGLDGAGVEKNTIVAADFNADGAADIGHIYKNVDRIAMEVLVQDPHANGASPGFSQATFTPDGGSGMFIQEDAGTYQFVVGDFTGDRRPDLAYAFVDDRSGTDRISIDVYENSGVAREGGLKPGFLGPARWLDQGGEWRTPNQFLPAEFTGDSRADIAFIFKDDELDNDSASIDILESNATVNNGNAGFKGNARWATQHGAWQINQAFLAGDFTSDGRTDIAYAFLDDTHDDDYISLDVEESSPTANGTLPGFLPNARWSDSVGLWATSSWVAGDFNNDCSPDLSNVFKTGDTISEDNHANLFVPNKTVDFSYVPPNITTTTCGNVAIGQARPDRCNPGLSVSNNAPATFPIGQTPVVWTVADNQGHSKNVTQIVTVEPGADPSCLPPGTTIVQNVPPRNPSFDMDINPMNGVPDYWTPGGAYPTLVPGYAGGKALKLTATPQTPNVYVDMQYSVPITPVTTTGLFLHVRALAYTSGALSIGDWEGNMLSSTNTVLRSFTNWAPPSSRGVLGSPGQWLPFEGEYSIPVGTVSYRLRLRASGNGYILFDDLSLKVVRHQ